MARSNGTRLGGPGERRGLWAQGMKLKKRERERNNIFTRMCCILSAVDDEALSGHEISRKSDASHKGQKLLQVKLKERKKKRKKEKKLVSAAPKPTRDEEEEEEDLHTQPDTSLRGADKPRSWPPEFFRHLEV